MTQIHKIQNVQQFQTLCKKLGLRVTDWFRSPQGLCTHAFSSKGALITHLILDTPRR